MDLQLTGKTAVVLGGTRGIGRAIAETLAAEGANVAVCARNADQVAETVAALKATGASVDIMDGAALKAWIASAGDELGGIDMLVSNAGAMAQGGDPASWEQNFRLDVLGMVNAFDAAKPYLLKAAETHGDASFVIIASVSAAETDNASSYGPIKAALIHYAKGLARQYAGRHIRTNVVSPGTVYFKGGVWNMVETNMPEMFKGAMERNPMGRMATPDDIAKAAVFLSSPLSSFTTGINMLVDGAISRRVNF
ncbi:MAG: SDR family oxidoreductase [Caulobacter sp.]|nr:SDR family oxidoreductase [Caulobacter sp.]